MTPAIIHYIKLILTFTLVCDFWTHYDQLAQYYTSSMIRAGVQVLNLKGNHCYIIECIWPRSKLRMHVGMLMGTML